jgi:hypothetical protein
MYSLLCWWNQGASLTRNAKWEKLSKIAAGGEASVFEHMRTFKRDPKPVFDKLKYKNGTVRRLRPSA